MGDTLIKVTGSYLLNKGSAMMVEAIKQRLGAGSYLEICGAWLPRAPRLGRPRFGVQPATFLPRPLRRRLGLVASQDLAAVLDNSGFQYSDQWTVYLPQIAHRADGYARARAAGAKVILLPQAFGPFTNPQVRDVFRKILESVDLVFAREEVSCQYLLEAGCPPSKAALAPDFTVLVKGQQPEDASAWKSRVCIVPNIRMTDRTPPESARAYLALLTTCIGKVKEKGLEPVILIHEKHDAPLARSLQEAAGHPLRIIDEPPLASKGILGACHAVIGSRFHSLIGSLSQGVPTLGTSWSHKYAALFKDYEAADFLLKDLSAREEAEEKLRGILEDSGRRELIAKLQKAAARHQERVHQMWERVEGLIFPS